MKILLDEMMPARFAPLLIGHEVAHVVDLGWRLAELARLEGATPGSFAPYPVQVLWRQMLPLDDAAEAAKHVALVEANLESHRTAIQQLDVADDPDQELARIQQDIEQLTPPPPTPLSLPGRA